MTDGTSSWKWPRIIAASVLIVCIIIAANVQTPLAYVGLAVIFVLCVMMAFVGVATPRHYAIGAFIVTAILAGAAIIAPPSWPLSGPKLMAFAVTPALFGVSMLFWAERDDPKHWMKNVAGMLTAAIIATVTYASLFGDYVAFLTNPWMMAVGSLAMVGLARTAGKAWQWPLSILAMAAMAAILARVSHADLPDRLTDWIVRAAGWAHAARIWPVVLTTIVWLLICLQSRFNRQQTLTSLAVVVLLGIMAREVWMLTTK